MAYSHSARLYDYFRPMAGTHSQRWCALRMRGDIKRIKTYECVDVEQAVESGISLALSGT